MAETKVKKIRRVRNIKKNDDLYNSIGVDNTLSMHDDTPMEQNSVAVEETIDYKRVEMRKNKPLRVAEYDYQEMAVNYSKQNVAQQLGNYRCAMDFLAHVTLHKGDDLVDRLKKLIYDFPNIDMSSYLNKTNAKRLSWVVEKMEHTVSQKYLGSIYNVNAGMGILGAMLLDSSLRFENIRSFDYNGTCQFLADEMMEKELLQDWRFKSTTQDMFDIDYAKHTFVTRMQDGKLSTPFDEIPGTIINTEVSRLKDYASWYNMIPDIRRVIVMGETGGDMPCPFPNSQVFNKKFPMSFELYSGVLSIDEKQYFLKIGHK